MPLYLAMVFKIMRAEGVHEGCQEQIDRLFRTGLYGNSCEMDEGNRFRLDDWELRDSIQTACKALWPDVTSENLFELTDYQLYKDEFLRLFGFGVDGVDYDAEVDTLVSFKPLELS